MARFSLSVRSASRTTSMGWANADWMQQRVQIKLRRSRLFSCSMLNRYVRFTPESGHVQRSYRCPLWANSGHRQALTKAM
jgi:hypothetical protein